MSDPSEFSPEPANLRFLRRLVTTLLIVMILGFLALIFLFVMRFSASPTSNAVTWPSNLQIPEGTKVIGLSKTAEFYAVISDGNQVLIFSTDGRLTQTLQIEPKEQ